MGYRELLIFTWLNSAKNINSRCYEMFNRNQVLQRSRNGFTHVPLRLCRLNVTSSVPSQTVIQTGGFTIAELLVVIVVIGILAAITIVSYTGISNKATVASLQSDLTNAKKQLSLYYVDHGYYPITPPTQSGSTYCTDDSRYCYKASSGNVLTYLPTTATNTQSYTLFNNNAASSTIYTTTSNTAPSVFVSTNWYAGIAGTALANKWVYKVDLAGSYKYKTTATAVTSPQGEIGLDSSLPNNMVLVSPQINSNVDFSAYPAQNACKVIGGRLPNTQELQAFYVGRSSDYGNDFKAYYWSSTENSSDRAYDFDFINGNRSSWGKTNNEYVRCVSG